jgi:L,D-peptidoglycan transpeptidase YkuD (ErfK/YbiS/YcfS/YnhG family)|tara:strand:- start:95401 stop:95904 length:504 start_codon:yes stop_codon:yes gene_type:complete
MDWIVSGSGSMNLAGRGVRAAHGRAGLCPESSKQEGDGATPTGRYALRRILYRADRVAAPKTALPSRRIRADDGWCDDAADPAYNRPVRLPYPASHETLFREDGLYDLILVVGHNDDPPVPGAGSAIFLHCRRGDYEPTEGCIALDPADVIELLTTAKPGDYLVIEP